MQDPSWKKKIGGKRKSGKVEEGRWRNKMRGGCGCKMNNNDFE